MRRPTAWLALLLLLFATAAAAQALALRGANGSVPLAAHIEMLEDADGRLDIGTVRGTDTAARFAPRRGSGDLNLGYSASAWWLRVTLQPDAAAAGDWLLEVAFPTLDRVDFYAPGSDTTLVGGDERRFAERPLRHRHFVFPLTLAAGETQTLYLRVQSSGSLTVPLTLWRPAALHAADQDAYGAHALYYGMLLALGLYNLLLWFSLRDRSYLAYVAFVAAMAVGQLAQGGLGYQYLWPDWRAWEAIAFSSGYAATGFFGALFTRIFLDTRRHHPRLDRVIVALAFGFAAAALAPLLLPYRQAAIATSLLGVSFSAVAVISAVACLRRGDVSARFFLAAWALLLVGVALMGLRNMALLPTNVFTANGIQIGSALEILLLSFALADRIHLLRREKEAAQAAVLQAERRRIEALQRSERELEARVAERTRELAASNQRLTESEKRLHDMAHHDPLTGLANRLLLFERIGHAQQLAARHGRGFAVLLIDLDGFKTVNDTLGHDAGDQLLLAVARRLRDSVRSADTVARIGGDEFVVLIEECGDADAVKALAEKIVAALRRPVVLDDGEVTIGASVGIARWPEHGEGAEALLRAADQAMYSAKRIGRNRVAVAA
ncbi:diguanylate cyclase [Azospira restricta]|uniref:Diguanylate cyclase n=1 Tax=Azospira restricta TaxID=404405 RepID=A0A974SQE7_9RHOO|nr:diguanylate cyclase [Azospira restricta]QRJ64453.1 diguanylate cyclase [Azospira restricta]